MRNFKIWLLLFCCFLFIFYFHIHISHRYIDCVKKKVEKHLINHGLGRWVGSVPVDELLVESCGDYNVAMRNSIVRARDEIDKHERAERSMHRKILKHEVKIERGRRARGGMHWDVKKEVGSLLERGATRSATTSVNDLAFMLLPELQMSSPPKKKEGEWADAWNVLR